SMPLFGAPGQHPRSSKSTPSLLSPFSYMSPDALLGGCGQIGLTAITIKV
ncbi:hypothetical protein TNCV_993441, partial [Trichonephila clavipes]